MSEACYCMADKQGWAHIHVGRHLKLISGFPFPSQKFSSSEGFPLIRIRDVVDSNIETYYCGQVLPLYIVKHGDILIGMDGDFNIARWKNQDALLNQRVLKVSVDGSDQLDLDFIYYWLQPFIKKVNEITAATTVKHLSTKDLLRAKGKLPCRPVQNRIGRILKTIDQIIEKTEALIKKYQQIKAGLMHDLFSRGVGTDGKLRPPREEAPDLYQETPIGWIPREWEVRKLGTLAKIVSGITLGARLDSNYVVVPYLRVANVQDGYLDLTEIKTVRVSPKSLEYLRLQFGDVLMNEGGDFDKLGRGTVWSGEIEDCIHQNHVFRVRCDERILFPNYLAFFSESYFGKRYFLLSSKQSTNLASINSTQLNAYPIALPQIAEQQSIIDKLSAAKLSIEKLENDVKKLRFQKSGLMHDLLTGKVLVTVKTKEQLEAVTA